ncbi:HAD-IA family hydrolase [Catenovulum sp. SM1970]|uniref:HAD-IA family hydrolase n=1 Tax=Marinifaba aquimaris TaxID=2741323 RepID=UPI0015731519|nr:HAD-IA family hydrolase [Marinifaba aquimaris]NTS76259.1 HAD-IA family hydrolase [Marinifaba aquimaris]
MENLELESLLNRYAAFIFDMDGTLLDSTEAIRKVSKVWCQKHGLDLEFVLKTCHGSRLLDIIPSFAPHLDAQKEQDDFVSQEAVVTTGIVEIAGANQLLQFLNQIEKPWGIATSSPVPVAGVRLNAAQLPEPDVFITGDQVTRGKPDPEHFELAAQALNQPTNQCLVFEDSHNGVKGALLAGCDVIVIGDHVDIKHPRIIGRINSYQEIKSQLSHQPFSLQVATA